MTAAAAAPLAPSSLESLLPFVVGPMIAISNDDPIRASLSFLFPFIHLPVGRLKVYAKIHQLVVATAYQIRWNLGGGQCARPRRPSPKSELPFSVLIGVSFAPSCRFGRVQSVKLLSGAGSGHDGDSATVAFMDITSACKVS